MNVKEGNANRLSYFFIILAATLWGTSGYSVIRLLSLGFTQMQIVAIRAVLSVIILLPILLLKDKKLLYVKPKDIWCFVGTGLFGLFLFSFCYYTTMELTSLSVAAVLLYTAPGFVLIFSAILFKEKFTRLKLIALVIIFTGCVLVTGILDSSALHISFVGFAFGICSSVSYASYSIFSRYALNRGYDSLTISFYTFLFTGLGGFPLCKIETIPSIFNIQGFLFLMIITVFCTILPYFLYTQGLRNVENGKASMMATIEPVVATIISVFIFSENFTAFNFLGIVCVISGILIVNAKELFYIKKDVVEH